MIRKAVIPAARLGARFLPATKAQPRDMLPVVDKPVIQYIVEETTSLGLEDIKGAKKYEPPVHHSSSPFFPVIWASAGPPIGSKSTITVSTSTLSIMAFVAPSKEIF